jgi:hypothetical protein
MLCVCCKKTAIKNPGFVAGHLGAEADGGPLNNNNPAPVCQPCNQSMGNKNMEDYINNYY